jgi:hypothetical protein
MPGTATISWIKNSVQIGPTDPLSIITSRSAFFYLIADLGVTVVTGASLWADQSGNGNNAVQANTGLQPAYNIADSNFGSRNSLTSSNNAAMTMTWDPPVPGTTPVWFWVILRQRSSLSGRYIMAGGNGILAISQASGGVNIRQSNTTQVNVNGGATIGVATRVETSFTNSTSDYVKAGSTSVTGANAGNSDAPSFVLFARSNASTTSSDVDIAAVGAWNGEPTSGEKAALDAWVTSYYGAGVQV